MLTAGLQWDTPHEPLKCLLAVLRTSLDWKNKDAQTTSLDWKNKDAQTLHYHQVPLKHMKMRSSLTDLQQSG